MTGEDIGTQSDWNAGAHRTHQDPAGVACTLLAGGDQASPVFLDCIRQLSVADQRGLCRDVDDCCVDAQAPTVCDALND